MLVCIIFSVSSTQSSTIISADVGLELDMKRTILETVLANLNRRSVKDRFIDEVNQNIIS